jgi:putative PIN family toxin of toxin-antitoxin system
MGSLSGITETSLSVIYDTNTFISAYGWGGNPENAVKVGFHDEVDVYVSHSILDEYRSVLRYDRLPFTTEEQQTLVSEFRELTDARRREVEISIQQVEDDPDDDKFLELAVIADVDYIVSGDDDLTEIGYFESDDDSHTGTQIVQSDEFLERIDIEPPESSLREHD